MNRESKISKTLYTALLNASADTLLLTDGSAIELLTAGESDWLDAETVSTLSLTDLFDLQQQPSVIQTIQSTEATEAKQQFEIILAPDNPPVWGQLGLTKARTYQLTLVSLESGETLIAMRDITQLRQLEKTQSRDVMRDPLTGLRSHRALLPVLDKAFGEAKRFDKVNFALIIIDIDQFSDINERYGWDAGDQVLRQLAESMTTTQRSSDFLCRFGDDQFAMLLSESDIGDAIGAAQRLQALARNLSFDFSDPPLILTLSVGTAAYTAEMTSAQEILYEAQNNLLIAQSHGGNTIKAPL